MGTFIASDHDAITLRVRELLLRDGLSCPASRIESIEMASGQLGKLRSELIIVVLSPDIERSLPVVRQLRGRSQGYLLAIGPIDDSTLILRAIREGADEYLNEDDLEAELEGALLRLMAERPHVTEPGRLVSVVAPNGGCGASTLAVNLAAGLAARHNRCALFDFRLASGDLAAMLNLKPAHTLTDICRNASRLDFGMFENSLAVHQGGIHLLAAPDTYEELEYITLQGIRVAVNLARERFRHVVVDLDHNMSQEEREILQSSDDVLLAFRLDFNSMRNAYRTLEYFDQLGISRQRVRPVVCKYGQPKEVPYTKAENVLGMKIYHFIPDDANQVNAANNEGLPVVFRAPRCKAAKSLRKLAQKMSAAAPVAEDPVVRNYRPQRAPLVEPSHSLAAVGAGSSFGGRSTELPSSVSKWIGGWLPRKRPPEAA